MKPQTNRQNKSLIAALILATLAILLPSTSHAQTILFNTTYIASGAPSRVWQDTDGDYWNYIPTWGPWPSTDPYLAKTSENLDSNIRFQITQRFAYSFNNGPATSNLGYPNLVAQNGLMLSSVAAINSVYYTTAQIVLSGLNPDLEYDFTFYGSSRTGTAANAGLLITFNGSNASTLVVAGSGNEAEITISGISSNPIGQLTLDFALASGYTYGYLNAFSMTAVPEPSTAVMLFLSAFAFTFRAYGRRRRQS